MPAADSQELPALVQAALDGDTRALARLISLIEDDDPSVPALVAELPAGRSPSYVIGLTGAPGVGKSTTASAMVGCWRAAGSRVAVLAVDPSSPFTGGALLGDRVRMQVHATDDRVFIRSMASRGQLGGLAIATPHAVRLLEAVAFDIVLVETVGVGQAEVDIASTADTTVVMVAPGMGDGIQAAKAGLLEVADVLVVNKADRDGADDAVHELRHMISTVTERRPGQWRPPVVRSVATADGGIDEVIEAIEKHRGWLASSGEGDQRRRRRAAHEIAAVALARVTVSLGLRIDDPQLKELADAVVEGELDTFEAARRLLGDRW